jgi:putative membrane protein
LVRIIRSLLGGFVMGSADLVPGVSGGTIALVLGIYERLVASIREGSSALGRLFSGDASGFKEHLQRVEWLLLLPLLTGILLAVISLARILETQLDERPTIMAGAFLGLVAGSVVIASRLIRRPETKHLLLAATVGLGLFLVLGLGDDPAILDPSLPSLPVFFGAGALAICAMILPGISGSLILVLVGMYSHVLGAVNQRDLTAVGVFVLGAIVGLALFSQILHWALRNHHDTVLAALIGLMAGSLRVLWPWPDGVDSPGLDAPGGDLPQVVVAAVVGVVSVFIIARLAATKEDEVNEPRPSA